MKKRNVAIIAHVDHGKTTLVDEIIKYTHTFRENEDISNLSMDTNDIEKEHCGHYNKKHPKDPLIKEAYTRRLVKK